MLGLHAQWKLIETAFMSACYCSIAGGLCLTSKRNKILLTLHTHWHGQLHFAASRTACTKDAQAVAQVSTDGSVAKDLQGVRTVCQYLKTSGHTTLRLSLGPSGGLSCWWIGACHNGQAHGSTFKCIATRRIISA